MKNIDPIILEIMRNSFQSIADEMIAALVRTAYSTNIKDRRDCSCALLTPSGEVVAQTELGTPFHLGVIPAAVEVILKQYPLGKLEEGDAVISNVLYPIGPGHLSDVTLMAPVIYKGEIIALVANQAHHVDVGGFAPGSMPFGVHEIFQEGMQIAPVKLLKKGDVDDEILRFILQNIRSPKDTQGDIMAQVAANNVGIKRMAGLLDKHGEDYIHHYMVEILNYAERSMRAGIGSIPEGSYSFEDFIEGDGFTDDLVKIKATVEVKKDSIIVDFAGTDKQVKGPLNTRISAARSCVYFALKCVIDPDLPTNSGSYRAIDVRAEEGSLVHAKFPAALCNANIITDQRYVDVILGALLDVIPERVVAACSGEMNLINLGGINPRNNEYYNYVETYGGGQGAKYNDDGMDGVHTHMTNTRNAPVEVIEATYPLLIKEYGLVPDSEGAGEYRGGFGMVREIEFLSDNVELSLGTDRRQIGPWGAFGGKAGGTADCIVTSADGSKKQLPSKITTTLQKGDLLKVITPGGGGWGDPEKRDKTKIEEEIKDGLISKKRSQEVYKK